MKFIARAKRKALEEKLATLDEFSAEAKEIRGKLGWGEPTPPAPPAPKPAAKSKTRPAVKKAPVVEKVLPEPTPILNAVQEEPQVVSEVAEGVVEASPPVEELKPVKATVTHKKRTTASRKKTTRKKTTAKTTRSSE